MFTPLNIIGKLGMSWLAVPVFVLTTLALAVPQTMTGGSVAPEFRGEWVPAKARCTHHSG